MKAPILGLTLRLDMPMMREILSQQEFALRQESTNAHGLAVGVSSVELLDACTRLVDLLNAPQDIRGMNLLSPWTRFTPSFSYRFQPADEVRVLRSEC